MESEQAAKLRQLIAAIQRRWGPRTLRLFGDMTEQAISVVTTGIPEPARPR